MAKGIAILQTTWFIAQCIARGAHGLPLTQLELATVAFASLNFATCLFWWYKPLDVQCPLPIYGKDDCGGPDNEELSVELTQVNKQNDAAGIARRARGENAGENGEAEQDDTQESEDPRDSLIQWLFVWIFITIVGKDDDDDYNIAKRKGTKKVPTFYAGYLDKRQIGIAFTAETILAVIFGAVHCIAWSYPFPSREEQILWRVSCVVVTSDFPLMALILALNKFQADQNNPYHVYLLTPMFLLYIVARIILLVQMFLCLRVLSPETFQTVSWTTLIPHF